MWKGSGTWTLGVGRCRWYARGMQEVCKRYAEFVGWLVEVDGCGRRKMRRGMRSRYLCVRVHMHPVPVRSKVTSHELRFGKIHKIQIR